MNSFQGLTEDTYRFFWEIAFQNEKSFFEANRERYKASVQQPLLSLASDLLPTALEIDPAFDQKLTNVLSRIRRDTRFTRDKSPYRDHAWLGFKPVAQRTGESFVVYAEFEREAYGYGMGMYAPSSEQIQQIRQRILARPQLFLSLVEDPAFSERYALSAEAFKRPRYLDAPKEVQPWLNLKRISFCYSSPELSRTMSPQLTLELQEAFLLMKPVYRFLMGLD